MDVKWTAWVIGAALSTVCYRLAYGHWQFFGALIVLAGASGAKLAQLQFERDRK